MSMNIHILASRNVIVEKTGEKSVQEEYFDEWQTPTKVSYEIEKSDDKLFFVDKKLSDEELVELTKV